MVVLRRRGLLLPFPVGALGPSVPGVVVQPAMTMLKTASFCQLKTWLPTAQDLTNSTKYVHELSNRGPDHWAIGQMCKYVQICQSKDWHIAGFCHVL